jgi:hypothetical protein
MHGSKMQGRLLRIVGNIAVGTVIDQESNNVFPLRIDRTMQSGPMIACLGVDENATVYQ